MKEKESIYCKKKHEVDFTIQNNKNSYNEACIIFRDNKCKDLIGEKYTDLCSNIEYTILDVVVMPFGDYKRMEFMEMACKSSFSNSQEEFNNAEGINWNIECVIGVCDTNLFKSQRIDFVNYCLHNSLK